MREQFLLDLAHLETPIQSTAVYFWAHTRKSTIHHLSRRVSKHCDRIFEAFLSTNRHEPFYRAVAIDTFDIVSESFPNIVGVNVKKSRPILFFKCSIVRLLFFKV